MLAHIVGVPVEEALFWVIPLSGLTLGGAVALARSYASAHLRRGERAGGERGAV